MSPRRLGTFEYGNRKLVGINNIDLISDRPTDVDIAEIREVKKRYPNNAVVISLMVEARREAWHGSSPSATTPVPTGTARLRLPAWHERARHGRPSARSPTTSS